MIGFMKKIIEPSVTECAVYYSDFTGKCFDTFGSQAELTLEFNYGSLHDGSKIQLHLSDEDALKVVEFLKQHVAEETLQQQFQDFK